MKCNNWKVLLVFSVLLMFSFSSELAAQDYQLTISPSSASIKVGETQDFIATLTDGITPVEGEDIVFESIAAEPLGTMDSPVVTNNLGKATSTYGALTVSGVDTIEANFGAISVTATITVNPDPAAKVITTPADTIVVVAQTVTIVAELIDNYGNHVDAESADEVDFEKLLGEGTLGSAGLNEGKIEISYMTDDLMVTSPGDSILAKLVATGFADTSVITTIGAAPDSVELSAIPATVLVSNGVNFIWIDVQLLDQYNNPSGLVDPYGPDRYKVNFSVAPASTGGEFDGTGLDQIMVDPGGWNHIDYFSSMHAGDFTVTGTSEGVSDDIGITHKPTAPTTIVLTPDSAGVPAGSDTTFTASATDQYDNHINMRLWYGDYAIAFDEDGQGVWADVKFLEGDSLNWKRTYTSYKEGADTAQITASYGAVEDVVTLFSAEPGDLDHFSLSVVGDSTHVSDADAPNANAVRIEAQDANNIRIWTYENPNDTITLTLDGSAAGSSQVVWFYSPVPPDTAAVGLTALIPEGKFADGQLDIGITNQIAEVVTVTATDTAGHTGTSPGLTWLPIDVAGFSVQLEGGVTEMTTNDTFNLEVAAIDEFSNPTDEGLPLNIFVSDNKGTVNYPGMPHLMENAVELIPIVATATCEDLVIKVSDLIEPTTNGRSDTIAVTLGGVAEVPIVSNISAKFGSGDILYSVAKAGKVEIKVYNKAGMEVGTLVNGVVEPDYYQTSLKGLNLSSDIYFVVMEGPGITKRIKATLIK